MSDESEAYAKSFESKSKAELEGMVGAWIPGSAQRAGVLIALERKKELEKKAEEDARFRQFKEAYEQTERHHREVIDASGRHARRAEVVAWVAIVVSVVSLVLAMVTRKP